MEVSLLPSCRTCAEFNPRSRVWLCGDMSVRHASPDDIEGSTKKEKDDQPERQVNGDGRIPAWLRRCVVHTQLSCSVRVLLRTEWKFPRQWLWRCGWMAPRRCAFLPGSYRAARLDVRPVFLAFAQWHTGSQFGTLFDKRRSRRSPSRHQRPMRWLSSSATYHVLGRHRRCVPNPCIWEAAVPVPGHAMEFTICHWWSCWVGRKFTRPPHKNLLMSLN